MAKTTVPQYLSATTSIIDSGDATAITIDGSENVAIGGGTNHDGAALLISHGDSGVTTFSDNADELVIENSSHAGISILTPNNASGSIIFGDSDDDDIGKIVFNHADNSMTLTATTVATSGNATIGGTLGVTGIATFTDDIIIGDGKTIGSASDVDAITIASNGQLTLTQTLIGTALDISGDIDVDGTTNLDVVDIDGAVDMATTLAVGGNSTIGGTLGVTGAVTVTNGNSTFSTASSWGQTLTLKNTNDDASPAYLSFHKDPASGHSTLADGDYIGFINMKAKDDAGNAHTYVELAGVATDVSSGAETSKFSINTWGAGTEYATNLVATGGKVGIGITPTHNFNLSASGAVEARFASTDNDTYLQISSDTDEGQDSVLQFLAGTGAKGSITYDHNTTAASQKMIFKTGDNAVSAMTIDGSGNVGIGQTTLNSALDIDAEQTYNGIGTPVVRIGSVNNTGVYAMYGAGWGGNTTYSPVTFGMIGTSGSGSVKGDFIVATRDATTDSAPSERLRITSAGNLGIGTTSPDTMLHVHKATAGSVTANSNTQLTIENNDHAGLGFLSPNDANSIIYFGDVDDNDVGYINYAHASNSMNFQTNTSVAMTINSAGKLGIGTTSPSSKIHTQQDNVVINATNLDNGSALGLQVTMPNADYSTDAGVGIGLGMRDRGRSYIVNTHSGSNRDSSRLSFWTESGGTIAEAMRINDSGRVGIGTTSPDAPLQIADPDTSSYQPTAYNNGTLRLRGADNAENRYVGINFTHVGQTEGFLGYHRNTSTSDIADFFFQGYDGNSNSYKELFRIAANGDLTGIDTSIGSNSDERLKENIEDFTGGLDLISKLKPRTFNWKEPKQRKEGTVRGFVAQEVLDADDYWVSEDSATDKENPEYKYTKDTETVYLSKLSDKDAMYVSAIKELITRLETAEAKITALEE